MWHTNRAEERWLLNATEVCKQTVARTARGVKDVDTGIPIFILSIAENHARKTVAVTGHIQ
jgi:hypothetical protein